MGYNQGQGIRPVSGSFATTTDSDLLGSFPPDGGVQPFAAGRIEFDFVANQVRAPNGTFPLGFPQSLRGNVNASTLFVDTLAQVQLPDYANLSFLTTGDRVELPIHLDRLTIITTLPCNVAVIATNRSIPPTLTAKSVPQIRQSSMTITKANAAGVADSWTDMTFVPIYGSKSLIQATFGMAPINCTAYPLKSFVLRNSILGDPAVTGVEFQVVGAVSEAAAAVSGYVVDNDVGGIIKVGTSASSLIKTSTRWFLIKLQARVQAGIAAGQSAPVVAEYVGSPEAIVESSASFPIGPAGISDVNSTGTGAISLGFTPNVGARFVRLEVTFTVAPATLGSLLTLTLKPIRGAAYNVVWFSVDPANPTQTSVVWPGGAGYDMQPGDNLSLAYSNPDARTYTARIMVETTGGL